MAKIELHIWPAWLARQEAAAYLGYLTDSLSAFDRLVPHMLADGVHRRYPAGVPRWSRDDLERWMLARPDSLEATA